MYRDKSVECSDNFNNYCMQLLTNKARNTNTGTSKLVHDGLKAIDFIFNTDVSIAIGFRGLKEHKKFYKKNTICFDRSVKPNEERIFLHSFAYDKAVIPYLTMPSFNKEIRVKSNPQGYICVYLANAGPYEYENLTKLLELLKNVERKIVFKMHPVQKRCKRKIKPISSSGFKVVKKVNPDDLFAAVVQSGASCFDLACKGIPLFCFDNHSEPYMCHSIASRDIMLLQQDTLENYSVEKYLEFIHKIEAQCIPLNEIQDGTLFRKLRPYIENSDVTSGTPNSI